MGAITGIVIGVLLVLTPLAVLGCFIFLHRYSGIPRCCPRLQVDPSPRGRTPHPPISGLDLQDLPTSPWIFSLVLPFLPHQVLTCGSFLSTILNLFCYLVAKLYPSLLPLHGLFCPCNFPGKNTGVGCHFLPQGIFLTQGSNPHLLHWQADSLPLSHQGSLIYQLTELRPPPPPECCPSSLYVGWQVVSTQKKVFFLYI